MNLGALVNATVRGDVYVLVDGKPRLLPRVGPPRVLDTCGPSRDMSVTFLTGDSPEHATWHTAVLRVADECSADLVIGALPETDGVIYLVDPITRIQFPHRQDMVTPATYGMWMSPRMERALASGSGKKRRRARRKDLATFTHARRFPLLAVSRALPAVTTSDTPVLLWDD